jgi:Ca2+-binding EF-hand superfamily protein/uncharacterized protein with PIN domain
MELMQSFTPKEILGCKSQYRGLAGLAGTSMRNHQSLKINFHQRSDTDMPVKCNISKSDLWEQKNVRVVIAPTFKLGAGKPMSAFEAHFLPDAQVLLLGNLGLNGGGCGSSKTTQVRPKPGNANPPLKTDPAKPDVLKIANKIILLPKPSTNIADDRTVVGDTETDTQPAHTISLITLRAMIQFSKSNLNLQPKLSTLQKSQEDKYSQMQLKKFKKSLQGSMELYQKSAYEKRLISLKSEFDTKLAQGEQDKSILNQNFAYEIQAAVKLELEKDLQAREARESERIQEFERKQSELQAEVDVMKNFQGSTLRGSHANHSRSKFHTADANVQNSKFSTADANIQNSHLLQHGPTDEIQSICSEEDLDPYTIKKLRERAKKQLISEEITRIQKDLINYKSSQERTLSKLNSRKSALTDQIKSAQQLESQEKEKLVFQLNSAIQLLNSQLTDFMTQNGFDTGDLFKLFDKNKDGSITRTEFIFTITEKLQLPYPSTDDLDIIYTYANHDSLPSLSLPQFFTLLSLSPTLLQKSQNPTIGEDYTASGIFLKFIQKLKQHMDLHRLSIFNLYTTLSPNASNTITRSELASLINSTLNFAFNPRQIEIIWNTVDSDGSGTISIKEFVGILG